LPLAGAAEEDEAAATLTEEGAACADVAEMTILLVVVEVRVDDGVVVGAGAGAGVETEIVVTIVWMDAASVVVEESVRVEKVVATAADEDLEPEERVVSEEVFCVDVVEDLREEEDVLREDEEDLREEEEDFCKEEEKEEEEEGLEGEEEEMGEIIARATEPDLKAEEEEEEEKGTGEET